MKLKKEENIKTVFHVIASGRTVINSKLFISSVSSDYFLCAFLLHISAGLQKSLSAIAEGLYNGLYRHGIIPNAFRLEGALCSQ